ncbi:hypothetical protein ABIA32_000320 [Streptacidiphilus sp. MAP12-20]|uniref:hypothetical protein n=1 Tax=Streptacidiphilus sp. MAP12-20 TaxID=3156299 RepID=UPI003515B78B
MLIHRTHHASNFIVLPNPLVQDRRLTYTARGLLADLLSRPDGWREDGRHMADSSPQGRLAIARALKELAAFGYYRVDKIRQEDGTILSVAHVWDTPQVTPTLTRSGSGTARSGRRDALPVKNREKEPTLPQQAQQPQGGGDAATGGVGGRQAPTTNTNGTDGSGELPADSAVATLFRVIRAEPRLRLGTVEAAALAPLVAQWLERGCTERDLAQALLPGLPTQMHSVVAVLRDRLQRKLPPAPQPVVAAVAPQRHECARCADPVAQPGICRPCAGLGGRTVQVGGGQVATARGIAMVRAAMRAADRTPEPRRA